MDARELQRHKRMPKTLEGMPEFKPLRRGRLPKPLNTVGRPRIQATDMLQLAGGMYSVVFLWRDGTVLEDRAFFAWWFLEINADCRLPLCIFHWHPSHKGFHVQVPCQTTSDYMNRQLPGAPELSIKMNAETLDPLDPLARVRLIEVFCRICGIKFTRPTLWN